MPKFDKNLKSKNKKWSFEGNVHKYFDDHVTKSVPFYLEVHQIINSFSDYFLSSNSIVYDIGCSTGTLLHSLNKRHLDKEKIKFIGMDISRDMINHAKNKYKHKRISFINKNATKYKFKKCSLILSIYTVQFIQPKIRQELINKIYESLDWGGAFILFEKVRGSDARFQDMMSSVYNEYKTNQGFNPEEILNKTESLKGVLEPFSREGNLGLLKRSGFKDIETIFRYNCFEGYLAIK